MLRAGMASLTGLLLIGAQGQSGTPYSPATASTRQVPSTGIIDAELQAETRPAFADFYESLSEHQQQTVVQFAQTQERGERGPLVEEVLRLPAQEQARFVYFVGLLSRDEKALVAEMLQARSTDRWQGLFQFLRAAPPEEVRKTVLFSGNARNCPDTYVVDGHATGAVFQCTTPSKEFLGVWNISVQRVIRGSRADPGIEKWQAQILLTERGYDDRVSADVLADIRRVTGFTANKWENSHICGAVDIGGGWVLTAAHCLTNHFSPDARVFRELQVRLGARQLARGGKLYAIDAVVIHAAYRSVQGGKDIALLRLKNAAGLPRPVSLFSRAPSTASGNKALVSGWGYTSPSTRGSNLLDINKNPQRLSDLLQQAELSLWPRSACNNNAKFKQRNYSITTGQLCVGSDDGRASCRGDSGGPLVDRTRRGAPRLLGVVSYAPGCALEGVPTVYTDVSHYSQWIANAKIAAASGRVVRMNDP